MKSTILHTVQFTNTKNLYSMGKIATQQEVKNKTGSTYPADSKKCCTYVDAIANYKAQVKGSYKSN